MVILNKSRHRKQHSANPCRMQAIVRGTSKRSTAIKFLQNCRTQCDPQHPADGRKDWNSKRCSNEWIDTIHEQENRVTVAPVCRALCYFHAMKVDERTTTRRMKDNSMKVENYLRTQVSPNFCRWARFFKIDFLQELCKYVYHTIVFQNTSTDTVSHYIKKAAGNSPAACL